MKIRKTLYNWLTNRYIIDIRDDENFELKKHFAFNYAKLIVLGIFLLIIISTINFILFKTVWGSYYEKKIRNKYSYNDIVKMTNSIDSLSHEISVRDSIITNIQKIIQGKRVSHSQKNLKDTSKNIKRRSKPGKISKAEKKLRKEFEDKNKNIIKAKTETRKNILDMFLIKPMDGLVTSQYKPENKHYGIDIAGKKNEAVKSIADGTVILSTYSVKTGYIIAIQHKNNLISFYKHNAELLKKEGNYVKSGEVIALMGNSGEYSSGPHLHFEMWHNGKSLNPNNFIVF